MPVLRPALRIVRGTDAIVWNIKFRNGNKKRFEFPIRTIAEDSIDPYTGTPQAVETELADHSTLFTKGTHSCDFSQFKAS
jgi:adenylylsulfate reductase subunit B